MQISTETQSGVMILRLAGSMDATTVTTFDEEWKAQLDAGSRKLVVDMSGLEYISSAGLRGILMLAKTTKVRGVALAFAGMRDMVAEMFKLSGFLTILTTYPDTESAVANLA